MLLPFTTFLLLAGSPGSRNGLLDLDIVGNGKFCCVGSALRGDAEAPLNRFRNGLLDDKLSVRPPGPAIFGGDCECCSPGAVQRKFVSRAMRDRRNVKQEFACAGLGLAYREALLRQP